MTVKLQPYNARKAPPGYADGWFNIEHQAIQRAIAGLVDSAIVYASGGDDTANIKAALAAVPTVVLPDPGPYTIASQLTLRGTLDSTLGVYRGQRLLGNGANTTILKAAPGFTDPAMVFVGNSNYAVDGKYAVRNGVAGMLFDNTNMTDTGAYSALQTLGCYDNFFSDLRLGYLSNVFTKWDLNIGNGTYTTTLKDVHGSNFQLLSTVLGDITTIALYGCSSTQLVVSGGNGINFNNHISQGKYSGGYQATRITITNSNSVSYVNGDIEGDGTMFLISGSNGIVLTGNNVATPGSYVLAGNQSSVFMNLTNCSDVISHNKFMNWNQGPLGVGGGTYLLDGGGNGNGLRLSDFNGAIAITYSASMTPSAAIATDFTITPTDGNAFTINNPTNPTSGVPIRIQIVNTFGVLGAVTWGAAYKFAGGAQPAQPANGFNTTVTFLWTGTVYRETGRAVGVTN